MSRRLTLALAILPNMTMSVRATDLSTEESVLIIEHVRPCMTARKGSIPANTRVTIDVITEVDGAAIDSIGLVSSASLLAGEYAPARRTFTAEARQALLDPRCNPLPVPARLIGHRQRFKLVFGP